MRLLKQRISERLRAVENRLTVRTQITAAVAAVSMILVGALGTGAALVSYSNTASLVNSKLASEASTTAQRLDRYMEIRSQEIRLFSQLEPMRDLWQSDPAALRKSLEQLRSSFTDFAWIGFARPDGIVAASTGGLLQGASVAKRDWFKTGLNEMAIGDVHEAELLSSLLARRADGEPHRFVDIAVPVQDSDGKLLGVLGAHLNWDWASAIISNAEDNDGDTDTALSILSKNGIVLVGNDKGTARYDEARVAEMRQNGAGTFSEVIAGDKSLTAYFVGRGHKDYQGLNWIVTARQPASVALAAAVHSAKMIMTIGVITALAGIFLAFFIARKISQPIHAITMEADRIGRTSGPTMLPRQSGSMEVVQLTRALRSLLRRIGFAEEQTREAELRATENALQFKDDITRLRQLADTDYLTSLMNRRAFLASAADVMEFSQRYQRGMATLMIDIDHFKKINDAHGHPVGDIAIKRIAQIIAENIKSTDRAARFGGEEFVVLLREIDQHTAQLLAERIRRMVETVSVGDHTVEISATVSIGIAMISGDDRDVQDMIERADQGLYVAKNTGRNRTFFMPVAEDRASRAA